MQVQYLEVVTPDVNAVCATYELAYGISFGSSISALGNARVAPVAGGGWVGVRAPLQDSEEPVTRPYWLVPDIQAAVKAAEQSGAVIAHPPTKLAGRGTFAIYIQGGIHHGLWQL